MGDNQSLATWATTNTGHGRTINRQRRGDGGNDMNAVVSSSNATINTSIAVRRNEDNDDPSIMTFTTAAGTIQQLAKSWIVYQRSRAGIAEVAPEDD